MSHPKLLAVLLPLALLALVATPACDKSKDAPKAAEAAKKEAPKEAEAQPAEAAKAEAPKAAEPAPEAAAKPEAPAAADAGEYVRFEIMHHDTAKGLVKGEFGTFKVVAGNPDFATPANAAATFEVDLSSVSTGLAKRDGHLKSPDFFDVAKFAKATVTVGEVKAKEGAADEYDAKATVDLHGVKKDLPVSFKVVDKLEGGAVVIEGTTSLNRRDWGVGAEPAQTNAADDAKILLRLKIAKQG